MSSYLCECVFLWCCKFALFLSALNRPPHRRHFSYASYHIGLSIEWEYAVWQPRVLARYDSSILFLLLLLWLLWLFLFRWLIQHVPFDGWCHFLNSFAEQCTADKLCRSWHGLSFVVDRTMQRHRLTHTHRTRSSCRLSEQKEETTIRVLQQSKCNPTNERRTCTKVEIEREKKVCRSRTPKGFFLIPPRYHHWICVANER